MELLKEKPRYCGGVLLQGSDCPFIGFALGQIKSIKPLIVDKIPKIPKPQGTQNKARSPVKMATEVKTMAIWSKASA